MYKGYRMKINGVVFPDNYIAKGSYSCTEKKRVVETWKDANFVEHEVVTGMPKTTIAFSIAQHLSENHADIMAFFQQEDDIAIEYYSDRTDSYRMANFRLTPIQFAHKFAVGNRLLYEKAKVTLTEN